MPITVVAVLTAREGMRDELLAEMARSAPEVHAEPGCRQWALHASGRDRVLVVESYDDRAALDAHASSAHFAAMKERTDPLTTGPSEIMLGTPEPVGDPAKGVV